MGISIWIFNLVEITGQNTNPLQKYFEMIQSSNLLFTMTCGLNSFGNIPYPAKRDKKHFLFSLNFIRVEGFFSWNSPLAEQTYKKGRVTRFCTNPARNRAGDLVEFAENLVNL